MKFRNLDITQFFYNQAGQSYFDSQSVQVIPFCNGWVAINKGDTLVRVNGIPLKPYPPGHPELSGESYGVAGNLGEVFVGDNMVIQVVFDTAAGGVAPWVIIAQKFYLPNYNPNV